MAQIENPMATTKEKVREKVLTLYEDYRPRLEQSLDRILRYGQIDFEQTADDWQLPKEIIQALANDMIWHHSKIHATKADRRRIKKYEEAIIVGRILNL